MKREDGNTALPADVEQFPRLRLDPIGCIDDHHGTVRGGEGAVGIFAEILVAGGVQQVDLAPLVRELKDRGGNGNAALLLHSHPIRGSVALILARTDGAGELDGASIEQQLLGERRPSPRRGAK